MASPNVHILTIDQTAAGDNNNTASREAGRGPVIDADGGFRVGADMQRMDIILKGTNTPVFTAQVYGMDVDGDWVPLGDPTTDWTNVNLVTFQAPFTWSKIKVALTAYTSGTFNASIQTV